MTLSARVVARRSSSSFFLCVSFDGSAEKYAVPHGQLGPGAFYNLDMYLLLCHYHHYECMQAHWLVVVVSQVSQVSLLEMHRGCFVWWVWVRTVGGF
jgi:hypothetical protein